MRSAPLAISLLLVSLAAPSSAAASRWVLGGASARDALGERWAPLEPSGAVAGGRAVAFPRGPIARTASQRLYRSCRVGVRGVEVPVTTPGTYGVVLRFLGRSARPLPFDVAAEGAVAAAGVRVVGTRVGWPMAFTTVVRDGRLSLRFSGLPTLCAVEVRRLSASTAPMAVAWSDDFLGDAGAPVADARWDYFVGVGRPPGWGAHELETYTYRPENVALDGQGLLNIVARRERYTGLDGHPRNFTSGRIGTDGRFAFTYGLLSARLKLPAGKGLWPAFWLLGDDVEQVGWPRSGEIDVAELMGSEPTRLFGSVHGPRAAAPSESYNINRTTSEPVSLAAGFHTYSALRLPGTIQLLLDGRPYQAYTSADLGPGRPWVFDKPCRIMLNLAVGGIWDGAPDATTPFPATLSADWMRVERWAPR